MANIQELYERASKLSDELYSVIDQLLTATATTHIAEELKVVKDYSEIIKAKIPRIRKLNNIKAKAYVVIDPVTGDTREASTDEARRIIMGYPQKGDSIVNVIYKINRIISERHGEEIRGLFTEFTGASNPYGNIGPQQRGNSIALGVPEDQQHQG